MKLLAINALLVILFMLGGCQASPVKAIKLANVDVNGPIEVTSYKIEKTSSQFCSVEGTFIDENDETMAGVTAKLRNTQHGATCDIDGHFKLENIPAGNYHLDLSFPGMETSTVKVELTSGDQVIIEAILARYGNARLEKPIIYLYPEEKIEVEVQLIYDGKLTTTYPTYPKNGWKVNASPDGTLTDKNGREYYALYWEGKPRKPLRITEGFVVPQDETSEFLEEKLEMLGLNAREANEFIVFWLPILERNKFNLISFAGDDYLEQAKLNISPTPDIEIRICMVFQGLDEEIDFPLQELNSLEKSRNGFTVVEWGGQELPKNYKLDI